MSNSSIFHDLLIIYYISNVEMYFNQKDKDIIVVKAFFPSQNKKF